jgi:hypothetical protein
MANRVALGKLDSTNYGLRVSKENENVLTTASKNLVFDSTVTRCGQIYAGGSNSGTSSTITWTSGSKPTLTYIPMYLIFEQGVKVLHEFETYANIEEAGDLYQINNQAFGWELTNSGLTPKTTNENGWITNNSGNQQVIGDDYFNLFYVNRTSNATSFLVLRIPCAYGFMGSTYVDASGTSQTFGSSNHPTFGNSNGLWT